MTWIVAEPPEKALLLLRNKAIISIFRKRATGRPRRHNSITALRQGEEN
jgi:hypothetical protein